MGCNAGTRLEPRFGLRIARNPHSMEYDVTVIPLVREDSRAVDFRCQTASLILTRK